MADVRWGAILLLAGCGRVYFDPRFDAIDPSDAAEAADAATDSATPDALVFTRLYGVRYGSLHEIDPVTFTTGPSLPLCPNETLEIATDIAFDATGAMFLATQMARLYRADVVGGTCTRLPDIASNALAIDFVPRGVVDPQRDMLLIGGANQRLYRYYLDDGSLAMVGPLGGLPAGDTAWTGSELFMSLENGATDRLSRVNTTTGSATTVGDLGMRIWGLSWFENRLIGFSSDGGIVEIDPSTAMTTTLVSPDGMIWSGAATAP